MSNDNNLPSLLIANEVYDCYQVNLKDSQWVDWRDLPEKQKRAWEKAAAYAAKLYIRDLEVRLQNCLDRCENHLR